MRRWSGEKTETSGGEESAKKTRVCYYKLGTRLVIKSISGKGEIGHETRRTLGERRNDEEKVG